MRLLLFLAGALAPALAYGHPPPQKPEVEEIADSEGNNTYQRSPAVPKTFAEVAKAVRRGRAGSKMSFADVVLQVMRGKNSADSSSSSSGSGSSSTNYLRKPGPLPRPQQAVVETMMTNKAAKTSDKKASGKGKKHKLEHVLKEVLSLMSGGSPDLTLYNLRDALTGETVLNKCVVDVTGLLGAGGTAVVIAVSVRHSADAEALGLDEFAVKMPYYYLGEMEQPSRQLLRLVHEDMQLMLETERQPLRLAAAAAAAAGAAAGAVGGAPTARKVARQNQWVVPLFVATVGSPKASLQVHQNTVFGNSVLLSEVMLGDGADLMHESPHGFPVERLPVEARVQVCLQVLETVARLHATGWCHADIKPENFLISKSGKVHLADFGMAGEAGDRRKCTEKITPLFMDPSHAECFVRKGETNISHKYDAWSAGLTCYVLMTNGRLPFRIRTGRGMEEYLAMLDTTHTARSLTLQHPSHALREVGVPAVWAAAVSELLNRDRAKRPTPLQLLDRYPELRQASERPKKKAKAEA
ncbi:Rhoptry kinase family protein ROP30, putative [Eimeria tenella]|uniref:mitogen-activated protein kinase kinase n=1 Tax=Eimeria tenella TaxID=5802 RepID=U6KGZ9_EIMTE|nr:Rhoptry kinase family protein ROP30, putative [Eimeria tenella]CDJ37300.1 Rhoptry kinase family protein ROP30, putative [Eimeria tenella]|eukprot:XP_013228138.1 Rhoptry kinase family protein ROP30, putative [Eimeria tenella]